MPNKNQVITVTTQPEDGAVQVEVAISLRPRRPKASPDAQIAPAADLPGPPRIPRITRLMALAIKFQVWSTAARSATTQIWPSWATLRAPGSRRS